MTIVAVLGLGIMGNGIAANLLKAGLDVRVYNRTPAKARRLMEQGAAASATPAEAATGADVVISVVGDDEASRAVWLGAGGALDRMRPGALAIESSTVSPAWLRELQAAAAARGVKCIDAPLGGSKPAAEAGTLTLFVGAESETLEQARPVLSAFAQNILHLGPPGAGAIYKLINNMLGAIQVATLAEALALADAAGLDPAIVSQAISQGAASSPIVKTKLERMLARDYSEAHFALRWMHKDVRYAVQAGDALGLALPLAVAARERYGLALEQGLGDADFAAVRQLAGKENV